MRSHVGCHSGRQFSFLVSLVVVLPLCGVVVVRRCCSFHSVAIDFGAELPRRHAMQKLLSLDPRVGFQLDLVRRVFLWLIRLELCGSILVWSRHAGFLEWPPSS